MFRPLLTCPTYHYVGTDVPAAVAHLNVSTTPEDFEAHLDHFETAYDIVDVDTLLHRPWPKRPLLLTFDDSYRSMADVVAPILKRRGLPGIVFLNPDMILRGRIQFDHALSLLAAQHGERALLDALRLNELGADAHAVGSVQSYLMGPATSHTPAQRDQVQAKIMAAFGAEADLYRKLDLYLRPSDVPKLIDGGLEVANHTASHARCRGVTGRDLYVEIVLAKRELQALSGRPVRAFSMPYGSRRDLTPEVQAVVAESGHEVVFLGDGRLSAFGVRRTQIWDRVPMDGISPKKLRYAARVQPRLRGAADAVRNLSFGWPFGVGRQRSPKAA